MKRFLALLLVLVMIVPAAALAEGLLTTEEPAQEAPVATPTRTLEKGLKGDDVLAAQYRLLYYGYYTGPLDSSFGSVMVTAVKQFQRRNELTVDGKIGPATRAVLYSDGAVGKNDADPTSTLSVGMSGEEVKQLQRALRETYYYAGNIDGVFGANVTRAGN